VLAGGVDAFNVLGTTGEFSLVAPRYRRGVIEAAVTAARGRAPVMAGCGRPSLAETISEVNEAEDCGALAALVTPSYYFPLTDEEISRFFTALAANTKIPLLYYHIPQLTRCLASVPLLVRMAEEGVIVGVKDSSGDASFFASLLAAVRGLRDFRTFIGGSAFLLAALTHGADGVIGALSNFAPGLDRDVIDAVASGDIGRARRAQSEIVRANELLFLGMRRNPAIITKVILASLGICGEAVFPPLSPLDALEKCSILDALASFCVGEAKDGPIDAPCF
jgi:4-hydroxy-tetrahydrodipicolinate synthase